MVCGFTLKMVVPCLLIAVVGVVGADMQGLHQDYMTRGKWDGVIVNVYRVLSKYKDRFRHVWGFL